MLEIPRTIVYLTTVLISVIMLILAFPMMPIIYIVSGRTYSGEEISQKLDNAINARYSPMTMINNVVDILRAGLDE